MTPAQLKQILPQLSLSKAEAILPAIVEACRRWDITTKNQVAAFLAQCGHESGAFQFLTELASGAAYEGRADLGNTQPGDGPKFRGHGAIQLTGRTNHRRAGQDLGLDLENQPELAGRMPGAMLVSGWYWRKGSSRGDLNELAKNGPNPIQLNANDTRRWNDKRAALVRQGKNVSAFDRAPRGFDLITLGVNGGFNGKPERDEIYDRALSVLPENPLEGSPATTFNTASTGGTSSSSSSSSSPIVLLVLGVAAFMLWRKLKK